MPYPGWQEVKKRRVHVDLMPYTISSNVLQHGLTYIAHGFEWYPPLGNRHLTALVMVY